MKKIISLFFLLFGVEIAIAQPAEERIAALYDTISDVTEQVRQLLVLSSEYSHSQPEKRGY